MKYNEKFKVFSLNCNEQLDIVMVKNKPNLIYTKFNLRYGLNLIVSAKTLMLMEEHIKEYLYFFYVGRDFLHRM